MESNYDNSARFYDQLSRLVFGRAIVNAQVYLLQYITPNARVLIAGGGTGWILEEIARIHPSGLQISYVEVSAKMITLSQKRKYGNNRVTFINNQVEAIAFAHKFDVVITPFLLDNFSETTLKKVFDHLHQSLKQDGLWLYADFQLTGKWWQPVLLKTMHIFFRLICSIEASKMPDTSKQFGDNGYIVIHQKSFFGDFIGTKVLNRP